MDDHTADGAGGPGALPESPHADPAAGELVTETLDYDGYSPVFDAERFSAHERFFVEDVGRWARSRFGVALPAERTAVFGVSAGGELDQGQGCRRSPGRAGLRAPAGVVVAHQRHRTIWRTQ